MAVRRLACQFALAGNVFYHDTSGLAGFETAKDILLIYLNAGSRHRSERDRLQGLAQTLSAAGIGWLRFEGGRWIFSASAFRAELPDFDLEAWVQGEFAVQPHWRQRERETFGRMRNDDRFEIEILPADIMVQSERIFLSHKSIDKPRVRRYFDALSSCGLNPWLDERDLHAGSHLERGLVAAFEQSCAAVFFISPDYSDRDFLASEVDLAVRMKRDRGERFSIICLRFGDEHAAEVPSLLRSYVWKQVTDDIVGLTEIIRALPLRVGVLGWRGL